VEYRAAFGYGSEVDENTIGNICRTSVYPRSKTETKEHLAVMIERGGYYRNLEKYLGQGICFVLGTTLSESQ
jgi:hypothetical protein